MLPHLGNSLDLCSWAYAHVAWARGKINCQTFQNDVTDWAGICFPGQWCTVATHSHAQLMEIYTKPPTYRLESVNLSGEVQNICKCRKMWAEKKMDRMCVWVSEPDKSGKVEQERFPYFKCLVTEKICMLKIILLCMWESLYFLRNAICSFLALFLGQICLGRSDQGQNGPDKTALRVIRAHFSSSTPVRWWFSHGAVIFFFYSHYFCY